MNYLTFLKYSLYAAGVICIAIGIVDKVIKGGRK